LLDKYDSHAALALLEKDEDEFLQHFRSRYMDITGCLPIHPIAKTQSSADQNIAELHKITVFRHLAEFVGARKDIRQHKIDLEHTANYNANICGSVVGINGSKPFGVFDS
jgi:hypothetical protein